MVDIVVYTRPEVLEHKKEDGDRPNSYCYWELRNLPTKIRKIIEEPMVNFDRKGKHSDEIMSHIFVDDPDCVIEHGIRLYIAVGKQIVGYFPIIAIAYPRLTRDGYYELRFHSDDWKEIEPIPCKPFQGFKYFTQKPSPARSTHHK